MKKCPFSLFPIYVLAIGILCFQFHDVKASDGRGEAKLVETKGHDRLTNTFLWKLERSDKPTSYLLGTLHIGKANGKLSPAIVRAFNDTATLVTETNIKPTGHDLYKISTIMINFDGSLSKQIGKQRFSKLADLVGSTYPINYLEKMRPWAALSLIMYNKPDGYSEQFGIDMLLTQKAIENNRPRAYLESIDEALALLYKLPEDRVLALMDRTIDNQQEFKQDTLDFIGFYENNQFNQFVNIFNDKAKMLKFYPEHEKEFWDSWLYQELLHNRNKKWLAVIDRQLDKEPTLIAVGALHLVGDGGLIQQIKARGYAVTPVLPKD